MRGTRRHTPRRLIPRSTSAEDLPDYADIERLRQVERWLKDEGYDEVHLFMRSTVAFGCAVGSLLPNWAAVHVSHLVRQAERDAAEWAAASACPAGAQARNGSRRGKVSSGRRGSARRGARAGAPDQRRHCALRASGGSSAGAAFGPAPPGGGDPSTRRFPSIVRRQSRTGARRKLELDLSGETRGSAGNPRRCFKLGLTIALKRSYKSSQHRLSRSVGWHSVYVGAMFQTTRENPLCCLIVEGCC